MALGGVQDGFAMKTEQLVVAVTGNHVPQDAGFTEFWEKIQGNQIRTFAMFKQDDVHRGPLRAYYSI